jgi:hypothetical protein
MKFKHTVPPGLGAAHYRNGALFWQAEAKGYAANARKHMVALEWYDFQPHWLNARHWQYKAAEAAAKARAHLEALLNA